MGGKRKVSNPETRESGDFFRKVRNHLSPAR